MRITDLFAVVIHAGSIGWGSGKVSRCFRGMCSESYADAKGVPVLIIDQITNQNGAAIKRPFKMPM